MQTFPDIKSKLIESGYPSIPIFYRRGSEGRILVDKTKFNTLIHESKYVKVWSNQLYAEGRLFYCLQLYDPKYMDEVFSIFQDLTMLNDAIKKHFSSRKKIKIDPPEVTL